MAELNRGFEAGALKPPQLQSALLGRAIESYERVASRAAAAKEILTF
jgi:hypothetical protein